jgi:lysophospholipase L1-like esterase
MRRFIWCVLPALAVLSSCEPFEPWFEYAADDGRLQIIGRVDNETEDGPTYAHSGVTIRFRCDCSGVDVAFADLGTGGDEHTNFVNVLVDGKNAGVVQLTPEARLLRGARNLPPGEHLIEIVKRTEPYAGDIQFLGISLQGVLLDAPPRPALRMEFIGDSITCGYGNEASILAPTYQEPNTGYHSKNEDISKAYGSVLGREFNAEVITNCISGTGISRNLNGETSDTGKTFRFLYRRIYPNNPEGPQWPIPSADEAPHVIVINLGNNDFNVLDETGIPHWPDPTAFKAAYRDFVKDLRGYFPNAQIVCSVGPLMNDNYPAERKHWTRIKKNVSEMVAELGDPHVRYFEYEPIVSDPYGEDWHPTAAGHQQMAKEMGKFFREELGL